jgi:hypothetical protein
MLCLISASAVAKSQYRLLDLGTFCCFFLDYLRPKHQAQIGQPSRSWIILVLGAARSEPAGASSTYYQWPSSMTDTRPLAHCD